MMAAYDLGDTVALGITITNAAGAPANATAVTCTVTAPDGTSTSPTTSNSEGTGLYAASYTPTLAGRHIVRWVATGTNASAYTDEFSVRDLTLLPVVGYDTVLTHLNIPTASANEEEIRRFIDAAQDLAENYVGAVLGRRSITETYDGNTDHLRLRSPRAISITSVVENGITLGTNEYKLDDTGQRLYRLTASSLTASSYSAYGYWATGTDTVTVSYVAGFTVTPYAVQQGVLEIIRHLWQTQRGAVNVMSRTGTGDDFYPASTYSLPRRAMELLDPASLPGIC